jgi:hypothetical protein
MLQALAVTTRAGRILADQTNVRWTTDELVSYAKDAVHQIILARPDAYPVTRAFTLTGGNTKQVIGMTAAADGLDVGAVGHNPAVRLLRIVRNLGSAGLTPIRETSRVAMDTEISTWHRVPSPGSAYSAQHYTFDNISPFVFYIYPCPPSTPAYQIELVHSAVPAMGGASLATSIELGLQDHYINPLVDWVLYRAFSKDAEYAGNGERAAFHLNAFVQALQMTQLAGMQASAPAQATPLPAGSNWRRTGG